MPRFCVVDARSEPARSMSESFPSTIDLRGCEPESIVVVVWRTITWITACERDETTFAAVGSVLRLRLPLREVVVDRVTET